MEKCVREFPEIPQRSTRFLQVLHLHHESSVAHVLSSVVLLNGEKVGGRLRGTNGAEQSSERKGVRGRKAVRIAWMGLLVFIKPTRHRVRRSLPKKCCSQMDSLSRIYLLQSSFLVDYATVSQHGLNSLALSLLPACLAQGESDVGQGEDAVLSLTSSEIQSRYQELT